MGLTTLLLNNPMAFALLAMILLYSVILHELAHGWVANKMGDPTAKLMGRLSLNPLKHLDPVGSLMLLVFGFGWAKPVPVNFNNLRDRKKGLIWVSSAGIITNICLAFIAMFFMQFFSLSSQEIIGRILSLTAYINIILAAFNLIPIPPLDGSKILMGFLPPQLQVSLLRIEPFGFFIIIGLLYMGLLNPVIDFFRQMIISFINLLLLR